MSDEQAQEVYERARLGGSLTLGERPAVLVVDFSCGFTDPECALGAEMSDEIEATRRLLDAARTKGIAVVFTTIGFEPSGKDGGLWPKKVIPRLAQFSGILGLTKRFIKLWPWDLC